MSYAGVNDLAPVFVTESHITLLNKYIIIDERVGDV